MNLYEMCEKGDVNAVKKIVKDPKVDVNKEKGECCDECRFHWCCMDASDTPLFIACKKGHIEIVKELLKHPKIEVCKRCFRIENLKSEIISILKDHKTIN